MPIRKKLLMAAGLTFLAGCSSGSAPIPQPDIQEARELARLATTDLYFHTVGTYYEENGKEVFSLLGWNIWSQDYDFWTEYNIVVPAGIDASQMVMEVDGQEVTIWLPEVELGDPKVLTVKDVEALEKDTGDDLNIEFKDGKSVTNYMAPGSAAPSLKQQSQVEKESIEQVRRQIEANPDILKLVKDNTKEVLSSYIESIGLSLGRDEKYYQVVFKDLKDK